ncbi:MAG: UvrD-helicase domain-containing protein, partial [Microbacteriaceae bacterium]
MSGVRIGAVDLAEAIGLPRPTDEQAAVIESPMEPALVVAGAGSGKTETMASRVLWLLANGLVGVPGILGLTFTRKAAGELGKRIAERIRQLEAAGLLPGAFDPFDAPTITTYNAFANTVFRDNALLVGREAEATVLGEPSAWQLARALVSRSDDARLSELGKSPDAITQAVLDLGRAMGEHVADPAAVRAEAERFAGLLELPAGKRTPYASVLAAVESVSALPPLVDLAVAFAELKEQRGLVEFSDQVALALQVVEGSPQVATDLRERYPVVLLDEYQDTSVVQTRLLAGLFRGAAV